MSAGPSTSSIDNYTKRDKGMNLLGQQWNEKTNYGSSSETLRKHSNPCKHKMALTKHGTKDDSSGKDIKEKNDNGASCQLSSRKGADEIDDCGGNGFFNGSSSIEDGKRSFKNVVVLGVGFMFVFTAFNSLQTLQNTLNVEDGVGVISLSCVYATTVISCLISPWIIRHISTKWTIVLSFILVLIYVAANFYPEHYLLIPASILLGFTSGPLWSSQATYLTTTAIKRASVLNMDEENVIGQFNGIFWGILQLSLIGSNLLSAIMLSDEYVQHLNQNITITNSEFCGAYDCSLQNATINPETLDHYQFPVFAIVPPDIEYILLGIYVGCALMGIIVIACLLDKIQEDQSTKEQKLSTSQSFFSGLKLLQDGRLLLLAPMVIYTGLEQGFIYSDFTKHFINCSMGVHNFGLTMVCFGGTNTLSCFALAQMKKHIKRQPILIAGTIFNVGVFIVLLLWKPDANDPPMFYVLATCFGICDAIWQTQTHTLFGVMFSNNQKEAFANFRMFQAVGLALSFGYSYFLCVRIKVYILGLVLPLALMFYGGLEWKLKREQELTYSVAAL